MSRVGEVDNRPWGEFTVLAEGNGYLVKELVVEAGRRLSLQKHKRRSETWTIIKGTACIELGADHRFLGESTGYAGQAIRIPIDFWHRLSNPGPDLLRIIEVQMGICLESDIERIEDDYGRK